MNYVFGFEESYGYLPGAYVRDKDAVAASLLICEMAAFYKELGSSLLDELQMLYQRYGFWKHKLITFHFEGADGMREMTSIMEKLRNEFSSIAGLQVLRTDDYEQSVSVDKASEQRKPLLLPKSDVLVFTLENNCEVVVRPSGTEPKLKCYLTACAESGDESVG